MHTVIEAECTGCDLCVLPCPVDCIEMVVRPAALSDWRPSMPARQPVSAVTNTMSSGSAGAA
jgi:electron transport complex protein RnfB